MNPDFHTENNCTIGDEDVLCLQIKSEPVQVKLNIHNTLKSLIDTFGKDAVLKLIEKISP